MSGQRQPSNRELRTRKDLILAAGRMLKSGRRPTMEEVAAEALVSRATAYRYFSSVEVLLAEVPVDALVGDPTAIFASDSSEDAEWRVEKAEQFIHDAVYRNEMALRVMLANSISRQDSKRKLPGRQNRRAPLIDAALKPVRHRFSAREYDRLCAALSLIIGPESMIVCRDVLRISETEARKVKSWAVRTLVRAALAESGV